MNNNPKSSLDYSDPQLEQYSDNTITEVLLDKTEDESATKYVLIKHDYYSSDSDNGREMLSAFLAGLCESSFHLVIYLVDTGTKLLDKSNQLFEDMLPLIEKSEMVIADMESIYIYSVNVLDNAKIEKQSMRSIAEDLIYLPDVLILE